MEESRKNQGELTPETNKPEYEPEVQDKPINKETAEVHGDQAKKSCEGETVQKESRVEKAAENGETVQDEDFLEEKEQDLQNGKQIEAEVPEQKETGILESIKNEIRNTPRPKKILVSVIMVAMAIVSILGFAVYGTDGTDKEVSAVRNEEKTEQKPAKLLLVLEDRKFELDLLKLGYDGKDPNSTDMKQLTAWLD
ncbi:MAG: hypothetical protein WB502_15190, partial [Thermoactinomyces sp.]